MADKKGYYKLQAQARRESAEMLHRFRELHPEKFAELQARAKHEVEHGIEPERPVTRYVLRRTQTPEDIDRLIYPPTERHYLIRAKDRWGAERLFFESLVPSTINNFDVLQMLNETHPRYDLTEIIDFTPCHCPACIRRFPSS